MNWFQGPVKRPVGSVVCDELVSRAGLSDQLGVWCVMNWSQGSG
ncbi:hypothetical protein [Rossellomorea aquimaris]|nr:hypothetical protein [Rossellomorea aquimaris]